MYEACSIQSSRLLEPGLSLGFALPRDLQTLRVGLFFSPRSLTALSLHKTYKCGMALVKWRPETLFLEVT